MSASSTSVPVAAYPRPRWTYYLELMRPRQWAKNLVLFIPVIFSGEMLHWRVLADALLAFSSFCLVASSVYALNDIIDAEQDARHPWKRSRPVASGAVSRGAALMLSTALLAIGLGAGVAASAWLILIGMAYWATNVLYSLALKHVVILDFMVIASGFVLRVLAGSVVSRVPPSQWLLLAAFTLAVFLGIGKRRQEWQTTHRGAQGTRPVLGDYDLVMLDQFLLLVAGLTIVVYALFTISDYATARFHTSALLYTTPLVLYGVFRYLYILHASSDGEEPVAVLLSDRPLLLCVAIWIVACGAIVYWPLIRLLI